MVSWGTISWVSRVSILQLIGPKAILCCWHLQPSHFYLSLYSKSHHAISNKRRMWLAIYFKNLYSISWPKPHIDHFLKYVNDCLLKHLRLGNDTLCGWRWFSFVALLLWNAWFNSYFTIGLVFCCFGHRKQSKQTKVYFHNLSRQAPPLQVVVIGRIIS